MPTIVHGDFEWDEDEAASNLSKHGVAFEEAAVAMKDPSSVDFADLVVPANIVTLAASTVGVSSMWSEPRETDEYASSVPAMPPPPNDESMEKTEAREPDQAALDAREPDQAALDEMPEIDDQRFRRLPGRGHHAHRSLGEIVTIDPDLWSHFGSAQAVNDALRRVVEAKKTSGS